MKKLVFLLSLALLLPASASAADGLMDKLKGATEKLMGQGSSGPASTTSKEEKAKQYIIHLQSGGKIETDNYTFEKDKVRVEMASGAIYLDRSMVKSIEEVAGPDQETVQTLKVHPAPPPKEQPKPQTRAKVPPPVPETPSVPKDANGHDEAWWRNQVDDWKNKKADAQAKFDKAQADWNRYNGVLQGLTAQIPTSGTVPPTKDNPTGIGPAPVGSQFDIIRYQDLRGAARTQMDESQAQLDAANKMLNETLPDEGRKAGAPPGWTR